jgi:DNA topoisomerase-3
MLREGRELIPTAKAFQLMTLLRGLGVEELSKRGADRGMGIQARADGARQAEPRQPSWREIAAMTERMVKKAKEYDRDTDPGRLRDAVRRPARTVAASSRRTTGATACTGKSGMAPATAAASRSARRRPGAPSRSTEVEQFLRDKQDRAAGRLPLQGGLALHGRDGASSTSEDDRRTTSWSSTSATTRQGRGIRRADRLWRRQESLGAPARSAAARVYEHRKQLCLRPKSVPTRGAGHPELRLQVRPGDPAAAGGRGSSSHKLLATGKTDMLDKFVSMRTRRNVQGHAGLGCRGRQGRTSSSRRPSSRRAR